MCTSRKAIFFTSPERLAVAATTSERTRSFVAEPLPEAEADLSSGVKSSPMTLNREKTTLGRSDATVEETAAVVG